jgi:Spy/CpxP family protein refolding chaperone
MSKKLLVIALIISAAINLAAVITFGYYWWEARSFRRGIPSMRAAEGPDWRGSPLRHRLNLTQEQIEAINAKHEEMRSKMLPLMDELFMKRKELMALLREAELDRARVDALLEEIASLQAKVDLQVFENLYQIRDTLTPEQQRQFFMLYERQLFPMGMGMRPPFREEHPERMMNDERP